MGNRVFKMAEADDISIEQWKIKRLVRQLDNAAGSGTSMISLIIPPGSQLSKTNDMLTKEMGAASNIKSRINRQSVLTAIGSAQQRLKRYNRCPDNGLVIFCGTIMENNKEKRVNIDFEPFKSINTSLYLCDQRFRTEALKELLEDDDRFGFIIMDGHGCLYGTVCGSAREILHQFNVDLPKKHGRGGQSAVRFARLREEKRHNYLRKVAEVATQQFITNDKINVRGLVLAGSADFKNVLMQSDLFDPRLAAKVIQVVDISYGGENGFNQAIAFAEDALANVKFVQERKVISAFFEEVAQDTGKVVFGIKETVEALEAGGVDKLICWEELKHLRVEVYNPATQTTSIQFLLPKDLSKLTSDSATGVELEIKNCEPVVDWIAVAYKSFGPSLEFVTDKSQEGSQFVHGFGGFGGILRYKMEFEHFDVQVPSDEDDFF
eukprot:GDKJ01016640.1.p1 GENE.GDKJ01016640.1~~GDKJ01016640.1.p1  ORF type:complete len:436 (+),score=126.76 GDKJ01016640.1:1-1308(+)